MAVSATRRNYDVTMATPNGEWHQMLIPATSVQRAISKAYKAMIEKYPELPRGDIGVFSVSPELKVSKGEEVPNWPTIRVREDFVMPACAVEVHEFDVEADE